MLNRSPGESIFRPSTSASIFVVAMTAILTVPGCTSSPGGSDTNRSLKPITGDKVITNADLFDNSIVDYTLGVISLPNGVDQQADSESPVSPSKCAPYVFPAESKFAASAKLNPKRTKLPEAAFTVGPIDRGEGAHESLLPPPGCESINFIGAGSNIKLKELRGENIKGCESWSYLSLTSTGPSLDDIFEKRSISCLRGSYRIAILVDSNSIPQQLINVVTIQAEKLSSATTRRTRPEIPISSTEVGSPPEVTPPKGG